MVKIFIVILNWNRPSDTLECIDSLSKLTLTDLDLNLIIVDNASTDNSVKSIREALRKKVYKRLPMRTEIVKNTQNLGYAAGNNVGIRHALDHGAEYILILNNDIVLDTKLLVNMIETAGKYPKAAFITPKIYFMKGFEFHKGNYKKQELGKVIWSAGGVIDWKNVYASNVGVDQVDRGQFNKTQKYGFATGACVLCKAGALVEVGVFNEKYFMYFEDVDLSIRAIKRGWEIVYCPTAVAWHKVARSSGIGSGLNDYFTTRNRLYFAMKYADLRARFAIYRESLRFLLYGRHWQKRGVLDYYFGRMKRGSWR